MATIITYGLGGYDPSKPNDNIVKIVDVPDVQNPLDRLGVMATLNVVLGIWSLTDAANTVGLSEQDLVNEALAWAIGAQNGN
jgi:hypothetical protein